MKQELKFIKNKHLHEYKQESMKIHTVSSHMVLRTSLLLEITVHLPPLTHTGSSHLGSTPTRNR